MPFRHTPRATIVIHQQTLAILLLSIFFLLLAPAGWSPNAVGPVSVAADDGDDGGDDGGDSDDGGGDDSDGGGASGGGSSGGGSSGGGSSGGGGGSSGGGSSASGGRGGDNATFGRGNRSGTSRNRARRNGGDIGKFVRGIRKKVRQSIRGRKARPKRRARPARRAAAPQRPVAVQAPQEIVATGLSQPILDDLGTRGYEVVQRETLGTLGETIVKLRVPSGETLETARAAVRALAPAAAIDFNHFYRPVASASAESPPPECSGPHCAAPALIKWPVAPGDSLQCLDDMAIGLIDTGINADHSALAPGALETHSVIEEGLTASGLQHGTAVAALLVGAPDSRSPGLVPNAKIIAVDAFHRSGRDERSDLFTLVKGLEILASRNVKVINLSLVGPDNTVLARVTEQLVNADSLLVAAAGNAGPRAGPAYPAAYPGVIAVTAVDRNRNLYRRAGRGAHIDFAAPGVSVWTAASIKGARPKTGTSFAAPFVTAAIVLAHRRSQESGPEQIVKDLVSRALDLGTPGHDPQFGHGLI